MKYFICVQLKVRNVSVWPTSYVPGELNVRPPVPPCSSWQHARLLAWTVLPWQPRGVWRHHAEDIAEEDGFGDVVRRSAAAVVPLTKPFSATKDLFERSERIFWWLVLDAFLTVLGTKLMLSNDTTISWIIGVYVFSKNIILCMFWVKMIMIIIMIINKMFLLTDLTVKVKNIIFKNANYELYISF